MPDRHEADGTAPPASYFARHYSDVNLSAAEGLRRGQKAAIHELVGHLTLKSEPAIAVLPTGAGKTDVAILLPYILKASRVLCVVPSDSVRNQVAERFKSLSVLKKIGVLKKTVQGPNIKKLSKRITTLVEWEELRAFDVVVTIPSSISPLLKGVLQPPEDLFDLLLIDEAHHSPAKTWQAVLEAFPNANRALFTATPFRRDKKQIQGTIVVNYSLRDARKDEVFGDIKYRPVTLVPGEDSDIAIARAAEAALKADRAAGLEHSILVRADSIPHAEALLNKYRQTTELKLEVVHSRFTTKKIADSIERLRKRELDGVICVNMLGEGFDLPNLKIAALHAPHASLGVTLQFIGRFARVGDPKIGAAQFFAVPSEIEGEMEVLFRNESVWQDLIVNLAETRVLAEDQLRADLATFDPPTVQEADIEELSLYALRPMYHAKIYRIPEDVGIDISLDIALPKPFEVMHRQVSEDLAAAVIVAREQQRPRWSDQARFGRIEYELFVIHYDRAGRFLFISASRRADSLFRNIASEYLGYAPKGLPLYMVNRTLAGLTKIECFSVGMKNRLHTSRQESYRILAGRNAHQSISKTDGRLFHQGHIFCTALDGEGRSILLGYSSGSKIWSAGKGSIPELVKWCTALARKMETNTGVITAPGLDNLEVGVPLEKLPNDVFAVDWDPVVYEDAIEAKAEGEGDQTTLLAEFSLRVDRETSSENQIRVIIEREGDEWLFDFAPHKATFFTLVSGKSLEVIYDDDQMPIADFLNEYPLYFYCTNFAKLRGEEHFPCRVSIETFDRERIQCIDWAAANVDIEREFWDANEQRDGTRSVHDYVEALLNAPENAVVLYDHRSGEIADFLAAAVNGNRISITLYHCKGSGTAKAGDRLNDVYEVCGQVVKSFHLICDDKRVVRHVKRRINKGKARSRFIRGTLDDFEKLIRDRAGKQLEYRFVVVQPGISKAKIGNEGLSVLAAANEFIHSLGAEELAVLGAA
jgi:superfamily II DNA or RNA helicase